MKNTESTQKKNNNYTSIRVKDKTKDDVTKFLETVNKNDDCGKVTFDTLIGHFLEKVTKEDIASLRLKTVTWSHEEKRLRKLWEKKKGKVSDNKWKEMLFLGQLGEFISANSRLKVATGA